MDENHLSTTGGGKAVNIDEQAPKRIVQPEEHEKYGPVVERWGWISIGINLLLSILNLEIALASGSLAVTSEMVHNLVDLLAAIVLLIGLRISQRKNKSFPYGLYKVENVVSVMLSILIFFTGYEIGREALLGNLGPTSVTAWFLAGVALSAIIPMIFSYFELQVGRKANSPSLIASAMEYRVHIFTSGVVFISLTTHYFGINLDRIAALVVVVFILRTGWELLKDGMRVLLDASLDVETLTKVRQIIVNDPAVDQVKVLTGRNSGRYRFLEAEITIRTQDLKKAHDISQRIERVILSEVPHVERVLIHYEPITPTKVCYAFPLDSVNGSLSEHFGEAPFFALVSLRLLEGEIEKQEIIHNPNTGVPKAKGIRVAEWLLSQKVDRIILKETLKGKGPEYVFKDAGVEMLYTSANSWKSALDELDKE
jgi:cation diffusion facilitator family transporter